MLCKCQLWWLTLMAFLPRCSFLLLMWAESFMGLDGPCGKMKNVGHVKDVSHHPTSPFFLLPWAIEWQPGVGIQKDPFIHSFIPQLVSISIRFSTYGKTQRNFLATLVFICVTIPASTSLPVKPKCYSWSEHVPTVYPLQSSLSTSVKWE